MKNIILLCCLSICSITSFAQYFSVDTVILDCSKAPDNYLHIKYHATKDIEIIDHIRSPRLTSIGQVAILYGGCATEHEITFQKDTVLHFNDEASNLAPYFKLYFDYDSSNGSECNPPLSIKSDTLQIDCAYWYSVSEQALNTPKWFNKNGFLEFSGSENISEAKIYNHLGQVLFENKDELVPKIIEIDRSNALLFIHYQINHHWYIEKILLTD